MTRYLLDSNTLNYFIFRRKGVFERVEEKRRTGASIGTAIPVVAEILGGTRSSNSWEKNLPLVDQRLEAIKKWPFDMAAAREYARLYAELRAAGIQMQVIDLMIAAIARVVPNCIVVTTDSDFARVPGLSIENWTS